MQPLSSPLLQYSPTPVLPYSNTPLLQHSLFRPQYSNTPILQYSRFPSDPLTIMTSRKKKPSRSTPQRETAASSPRQTAARPSRGTAPRRTRRSVSVPLLLGTAIVLAVAAVGSYFWRSYQVRRLAPELLTQAQMLEQEGRLLEATQRIYQYLQINPDDTEATITLAETYDAAAQDISRKVRAIQLYTEAIQESPPEKRLQLRKRLAELLMEVGLFQARTIDPEMVQQRERVAARLTAAGHEALEVLAEDPQDPDAARILAWSLLARQELDSLPELPPGIDAVGSAVQRAVDRNPTDMDLAVRLARIYRSQPELLEPAVQQQDDADRARLADAMVDRTVETDIDNPLVYLARSAYRQAYQLPGDQQDLQTALELAPDNLAVRLANGATAQARAAERFAAGDLLATRDLRQVAVQHYQAALQSHPDDVRPYVLLSQLYRELGDVDRAVQIVEQGLQRLDADSLQLNGLMVEALLGRQDLDQAGLQRAAKHLQAYQRALTRLLQAQALGPTARRNLERASKSRQARLLVRQEKFDEALTLLNELLIDPAALSLPDRIATIRLLEVSYRAQQRWEQAAAAAEQWGELEAAAMQPKLLAANNWLAAGQPARAAVRLRAALQSQDTVEIRMLAAMAELEVQRGRTPSQQNWKEFDEHLRRVQDSHAKQPIRDPWRMTLLLAGWEQALGTAQAADQALQRLREAELRYPESAAFLRQSAEIYRRLEAEADAERALVKLSFVTAMQAGNWTEAQPWEERLQARRDDPQVFWQYYSGRRLIAQATSSRDPALDAAVMLLDELDATHPDNHNRHLLHALLCARQQDLPAAVEAYRAALDGGDPNEFAYEQLVLLLAQLRQHEEAARVLAEFRQRMPESRVLPRLAILLQRRQGDREGALELAQQNIESNPADPQLRVRLGQMLEELERPDEAQLAYEEALVLDPTHAPALSALIALYTKTERQAQAKGLLETLVANPQLDDNQRILIHATGLELLGDPAAAIAVLRTAISRPSSPAETSPASATPDSQLEPTDALRRALAEMLARQETDASLEEAEQLMRDIVQRRPRAGDAQRTLAGILLLKGGGDNRRQALEIFEQLAADSQQASQTDAIALARLRRSQADWQGATQALQAWAADRDVTPAQLRELIRGLLQQGETEEALQRIAQLERIEPAEPATVQLRIRWLKDMQRSDEIPAMLETFEQLLLAQAGDDPQRQSQAHQMIGQLYSSVDMHQQATERYRQVKQADPKNYGTLVRSLAQQGRLDEAIELCLDAAQADDTATPAMVMHVALLTSQPADEHWEQAEPLFQRTLTAHGNDPMFLNALATVRLVQKRHDEAIELYQRLLELQPKNVAAWNNLALALSEDPQTVEQSLTAIDRALDLGGHRPTFLDTKATILLQQGEYQEAVSLLEQAVEGAKRNPDYQQTLPIHQLHLAVAYVRTDRHDEAQKIYQDSLNNNLEDSALLTQTDLAMLQELRERYEQ